MPITSASELVDDIEGRVASGALRPGDLLPSVRATAAELGLAPNTVAAAYRQLRLRGVAVGRGRQGTTIAARTTVAPVPVTAIPDGVVDAMTGSPDPRLLPDARAALRRSVEPDRPGYGATMVLPELATAGGRWLAADGVDATHLALTSGAMDAVERLLVLHTRPGDAVGVEDPGHAPVHELVRAMGLLPVAIPLDDDGITPAGLSAALERNIRALVVTPRAQNPTGAALTAERVAELDRLLRPHPRVMVIEDDHAGPVAGVPLVGLDRQRPHWAVVRSVSKSLGPDLRLAFVAGDADTIARVDARLAIGPGWVSHLLQSTVATLLDDPATRRVVDRATERYRSRRAHLVERLAAGGVESFGRSGLQVWIPVAAEQPVADALRDQGYALRVGAPYRLASPPAVRVTVAALTEDDLDRIAALLIATLRPTTRPLTRTL